MILFILFMFNFLFPLQFTVARAIFPFVIIQVSIFMLASLPKLWVSLYVATDRENESGVVKSNDPRVKEINLLSHMWRNNFIQYPLRFKDFKTFFIEFHSNHTRDLFDKFLFFALELHFHKIITERKNVMSVLKNCKEKAPNTFAVSFL